MPRAPSNDNEGRSVVGGIGMPGSKPIKVRDLDDVHTATWGGFRKPKKRPRQETAGGGGSNTPRREGGSAFKATGAVLAFWVLFFGVAVLAIYLLSKVVISPAALEPEEIRLLQCEVVDGTAFYQGELIVDAILDREPEYVEADKAVFTVRFYNGNGERIGEQIESIFAPFSDGADPVVSTQLQNVGDIGFLGCEVTADLT